MWFSLISILSLVGALFFLLKRIGEILQIIRETFQIIKECQECIVDMGKVNEKMMLMFQDSFDFSAKNWEKKFPKKPELIKSVQKSKSRGLSEAHKKRIGQANKARWQKRAKEKESAQSSLAKQIEGAQGDLAS